MAQDVSEIEAILGENVLIGIHLNIKLNRRGWSLQAESYGKDYEQPPDYP